jgi:micrococcal nuclease
VAIGSEPVTGEQRMITPSNRGNRLRFTVATLLMAVGSLSIADHAGILSSNGNDWRQIDAHVARATRVISGDTIELALTGSSKTVTVHLLGIDAPDLPAGHGAEASLQYVAHRLADRTVIIRLDGTQTRNLDGSVRAYIYITPADSLNADLVRDGMAYADRREPHTYASVFEQLERDARSHHRGLWNGLRDSDMPAWRQQWLKDWLARRKQPF